MDNIPLFFVRIPGLDDGMGGLSPLKELPSCFDTKLSWVFLRIEIDVCRTRGYLLRCRIAAVSNHD
jgi:hypothetical protein